MKNRLPGHKKPRADRRRLRHERRSDPHVSKSLSTAQWAERLRSRHSPETLGRARQRAEQLRDLLAADTPEADIDVLMEAGPDWAARAQHLTPD